MAMHSRWERGHLIFYDGFQRWLDVIGPDCVRIKEEFQQGNFAIVAGDATGVNKEGWLHTITEVGGAHTQALVGGADGGNLLITTGGNENDGVSMQLVGECINPSTTNDWPFYFGCRFKVSDATQSDYIIGLCITDTDLLGGMTDGVYFRKTDGSTTVSAVIEKNSTETTGTAHTAANDTFYIYEILWDGSNLDFYVDGTVVTRLAQTNFPNDEYLTPSFEYLAGAAGADTVTIDWIRCFQIQD